MDLHAYFDRKRIYGRVFETRIGNKEDKVAAAALPEFDSRLALADLLGAIRSQRDEAKAEYTSLEKEQPDRPDLDRSIGNFALWTKDTNTARLYFAKAFDAGNADPRLCFDLAVLDREAKQPPAKIIPILERSLQSKPDYTEARAMQLGIGPDQKRARFPRRYRDADGDSEDHRAVCAARVLRACLQQRPDRRSQRRP